MKEMDDMSELIALEHAAQLGILGDALAATGHESQLIEPHGELPVTTLMVALGKDDDDRDRTLAVSIMPLGSDLAETQLVQFYVPMPFSIDDDSMGSVQRAVAIVNAAMAVGHFAVSGSELIYRYVLAMPNSESFNIAMTSELIGLLAFHQEHFGDYFEGIIDDEITLSMLPDLLAED